MRTFVDSTHQHACLSGGIIISLSPGCTETEKKAMRGLRMRGRNISDNLDRVFVGANGRRSSPKLNQHTEQVFYASGELK